MGETTNIEWCDKTFNPWIGCTKVSPACDHCYAEVSTASRALDVVWGTGQERRRTSEANWKQPIKWNAEAERLGVRYRVFCASLADIFDKDVNPAWRMDLFSLIAKTPNLDWLILTKRIGNVLPMCSGDSLMFEELANLWLGISICNQAEADRDIPKLLQVPAKVRFLSIEPMLGAIDLHLMEYDNAKERNVRGNVLATRRKSLDWVIVGGESGHNARPMHPDWARSLRDQCKEAGVPFLFKQWGEWVDGNNVPKEAENKIWFDKKRSHFDMYDLGLIMDMVPPKPIGPPYFGCSYYIKVGKKAAGRTLDGVTHNEYPEVNHG